MSVGAIFIITFTEVTESVLCLISTLSDYVGSHYLLSTGTNAFILHLCQLRKDNAHVRARTLWPSRTSTRDSNKGVFVWTSHLDIGILSSMQ